MENKNRPQTTIGRDGPLDGAQQFVKKPTGDYRGLACEQAHFCGYREPEKRGKVCAKCVPHSSRQLSVAAPRPNTEVILRPNK